MTMSLVQTITLGTAAPSITFSNIPQDATDLYAVLSWDGTSAGSFELDLQLNSTTNTVRRLIGNGSGSAGSLANDQISVMDSDYSTNNTFHSLAVYITNYTAATQHAFSVEAVVEANSSQNFGGIQHVSAGLNSSTSAVTSLAFVSGYLDFTANTVASLYKITKA